MAAENVKPGTYRIWNGDLVHYWEDGSGALRTERDDPRGWTAVDRTALGGAVKLSDDPFWPDAEGAELYRARPR